MDNMNQDDGDTEHSGGKYNYGVLNGGIYSTRHEAVGAAAILNRGKIVKIHRVVAIPNLLGIAEVLRGVPTPD